jgi:hypothetical protein
MGPSERAAARQLDVRVTAIECQPPACFHQKNGRPFLPLLFFNFPELEINQIKPILVTIYKYDVLLLLSCQLNPVINTRSNECNVLLILFRLTLLQ